MLKILKNPMFWLGADVVLILWIITDFIDGRANAKETVIAGIILILLFGLNRMDVEKERR
jgi:hypothetical protein